MLDNADSILQYWKRRKKHFKNVNKTGIILLQGKELDIVDSMLIPESMVDENIEDSFKKLK